MGKNFEKILPAKFAWYEGVMRSGMPSKEALQLIKEEYGLETILNVVGMRDEEAWHDEKSFAEENGITLLHYELKMNEVPLKEDCEFIMKTFRSAERPLLVHCRAGQDRTGFAMMLYLLDQHGLDKKAAYYLAYTYFNTDMPCGPGITMQDLLKSDKSFDEWFESYDPLAIRERNSAFLI